MFADVYKFMFHFAPLSLTFILILLIVFLWNAAHILLHQRKFEKELQELHKKYVSSVDREKYDPITFLKLHLDEEYHSKRFDGVPATLVTLGILGTFLGLGLALQTAAGNLGNADQALASLDTLLATVSFKFQTSAWGIVFSIVFQMTVLNHFHRFSERKKEETAQKMTVDYQTTAMVLLHAMNSSNERFISVAGNLEILVRGLTESTARNTEILDRAIHRIAGVGETLDRSIRDNLGKMTSGIERSIYESTDAQKRFFSEFSAVFKQDLATVSQTINNMNHAISVLNRDIKTNTDKIASSVVHMNESVNNQSQKQQELMISLRNGLESNLQKIQASIQTLNGNMSTAISNMNDNLNRMLAAQEAKQTKVFQSLDEGLKYRLDILNKTLKETQEQSEKLGGDMNVNLDKLGKCMSTMNRTIEQFAEQLKTITEITEKMTANSSHHNLDDLMSQMGAS